MPLLDLEPADFGRLLANLSPAGDAWPTEDDAVVTQARTALAGVFSRLNGRANYLVSDAFPKTSVELLPEWEASVGLPDPCAGEDQTIAQRQAHVVARLTTKLGPSIPNLTAFAAALGFTITITEFAPARAGMLKAGGPCCGEAWAHVWQVNVAGTTVRRFRAGYSRAGEPLSTWGNAVLVCEMNRLSPAHTIPLFAYTSPVTPAGWDQLNPVWA